MSQSPPEPARLVDGRFELLETLGEGGMGVVYRALDRERGVQVALKTLRGATPEAVLRFKTEFRALRDIRHPNLVELGELFESDGTWFFTMELVRGAPLLAWVRGLSEAGPPSTDSQIRRMGDDVATVVTEDGATLAGEATEVDETEIKPAPRVDDSRLRTALAGLASGLAALHAAGKVHRDVKPSNVIVDETGRAVLLDFGVVGELRQTGTFDDKLIMGTVSYMAPEQARGEQVGPPADWYALGVVLFQALTGRLPLAATSEALLVLKQHTDAPEISRFVAAPPDLAKLAMALLDRDPANRPHEAEIFAALDVPPTAAESAWLPAATEGRLFVGRRVELGLLDAALDASTHAAVAMVVSGESGVGKTALVDHFCELARATRKKATILRGRCHQRERVAFNAFDGIVHELARWLIARPEPKVAAIVPPGVAELVAVFPDLRAVPVFAAAIATMPDASADLRDRAFAALRETLVAMAQRGPIVLAIDDLQWADADSLAALEAVFGDRRAPPILLLVTLRAGAKTPKLAADTRHIALGGLAPIDAEKLLHRLDEGSGVNRAHVIKESNGHPLFLAELVRHRGSAPRLDDAIWSRASALDADSRTMLAGIALAGAPIPRELAVEASGLAPATAEAALDRLARVQLVRAHGPRRADLVEPFHDRVRESVLANETAGRDKLHLALARGLEERNAPADVLWGHFEAGGDRPKATHYLVLAAEQALAGFAFNRAVELYRHALAVLNPHARQRSELLGQLGDALANVGLTAEAARRYQEAATLAEPESDRQLDLLRRAAEKFLMSGHVEPGLETARQVLARVGMALPGRARTITGIVWTQFQTRGSALRWPTRTAPDPRALHADICWSISAGLSMVDTLLGAYFSGRATVLAVRHGTPLQITRALCAATVGAALMGSRKRAARCFEALQRAAAEDGSPVAAWYTRTVRCMMMFLLDNDFPGALEITRTLAEEWYACGRGPGWETDVAGHFYLAAQQMLGHLPELATEVGDHIETAKRTGDKFQEVSLRVRFAVTHLLVDQPNAAEDDIADALASWQPSSGAENFGNQRAWALWTRTRVLLYMRDFERLEPALDADWTRHNRALIARVPAIQTEWLHVWGTYLLGRAIHARNAKRTSEHAKLCRKTLKIAAKVGGMKFPAGAAVARMLEAGVACARGGDVVGPLRTALDAVVKQNLLVYAPFIELRLGEALGGSEGEALIAKANAEARRQGWKHPDRGAEMCIPRG
jgi:hypothetical protein